jgi:glycosyl transferase family 25
MDTIEKVVYINLAYRTDRRKQVEKELSIFPPEKVLRFDAIKDEKGHIGCSLSHIAVLKMAITKKWNNVLIVEDDMIWNKKHFNTGIETFNNLINNPYDVIVLGGTFVEYIPTTNKLIRCKTTTSYLIHNHYFQKLLDCFKNSIIHNSYIDEEWKSLQKSDNWFIIYPPLVIQSTGYSDIEKKVVNYHRFFGIKQNVIQNVKFKPE